GVPENFGVSARLGGNMHREPRPSSAPRLASAGDTSMNEAAARTQEVRHPLPGEEEEGNIAPPSAADFVIEADEYDTAFFDKRSKFVHYRAQIAVLNNLEYDHADIFPDVAAIQRQFHHFVRTVPGNGRLIVNAEDARLAEVLAMGAWTPVTTFGLERGDWQ